MKYFYYLLLSGSLICLFACKNNEIKEWERCRNINKFEHYFLFAKNHQTSIFLDSAIQTLNNFLLVDNHFFVTFKEDSNVFIKGKITNIEIPKSSVFALNYMGNYAYYRDTIYLNDTCISTKLKIFLARRKTINNVWLFCDSIKTKAEWITLFNKIDTLNLKKKDMLDEFAFQKWNMGYDELNMANKTAIRENIKINILIFFYSPVLIPKEIKLPIIE
jgi:hypothetical protein